MKNVIAISLGLVIGSAALPTMAGEREQQLAECRAGLEAVYGEDARVRLLSVKNGRNTSMRLKVIPVTGTALSPSASRMTVVFTWRTGRHGAAGARQQRRQGQLKRLMPAAAGGSNSRPVRSGSVVVLDIIHGKLAGQGAPYMRPRQPHGQHQGDHYNHPANSGRAPNPGRTSLYPPAARRDSRTARRTE